MYVVDPEYPEQEQAGDEAQEAEADKLPEDGYPYAECIQPGQPEQDQEQADRQRQAFFNRPIVYSCHCCVLFINNPAVSFKIASLRSQ